MLLKTELHLVLEQALSDCNGVLVEILLEIRQSKAGLFSQLIRLVFMHYLTKHVKMEFAFFHLNAVLPFCQVSTNRCLVSSLVTPDSCNAGILLLPLKSSIGNHSNEAENFVLQQLDCGVLQICRCNNMLKKVVTHSVIEILQYPSNTVHQLPCHAWQITTPICDMASDTTTP